MKKDILLCARNWKTIAQSFKQGIRNLQTFRIFVFIQLCSYISRIVDMYFKVWAPVPRFYAHRSIQTKGLVYEAVRTMFLVVGSDTNLFKTLQSFPIQLRNTSDFT